MKKKAKKSRKETETGKMLVQAQENASKCTETIEAGEYGKELGKGYMAELESTIRDHCRFGGEIYIHALQADKLPPYMKQVVYVEFSVSREMPTPAYGGDLWWYSFEHGELKMLWSIPHYTNMESMDGNPTTDPWLQGCIDKARGGTIMKIDPQKVKGYPLKINPKTLISI